MHQGVIGGTKGQVALFVTCLVDLYRPRVGFAAIHLLERAGYSVDVPAQGCCGQPNFNSGDRTGAAEMAAGVIETFSGYDYVVAPSGSCAAMLRCHYPALFPDGSDAHAAAGALAGKTYELTEFLYDVAGVREVEVDDSTADPDAGENGPASVTYHDGCAGLREMGIRRQPRALLNSVSGLTLKELGEPEACCGFGGLFCIKYPEISARIADAKIADIRGTGADRVVAGELGCLMQIEGKLHRDGHPVRAVHVAEVLAGDFETSGPVETRGENDHGND